MEVVVAELFEFGSRACAQLRVKTRNAAGVETYDRRGLTIRAELLPQLEHAVRELRAAAAAADGAAGAP